MQKNKERNKNSSRINTYILFTTSHILTKYRYKKRDPKKKGNLPKQDLEEKEGQREEYNKER